MDKCKNIPPEKYFFNKMTDTTCLVCNADGVTYDEREVEKAYYDFDDKEWVSVAWWNCSLYGIPKVTHYIPLPKPYNEESLQRRWD